MVLLGGETVSNGNLTEQIRWTNITTYSLLLLLSTLMDGFTCFISQQMMTFLVYLQKITNQCPLVLFNHGDQMIICLIMMCRLEIDAASKSKVINIMNGLPLFWELSLIDCWLDGVQAADQLLLDLCSQHIILYFSQYFNQKPYFMYMEKLDSFDLSL